MTRTGVIATSRKARRAAWASNPRATRPDWSGQPIPHASGAWNRAARRAPMPGGLGRYALKRRAPKAVAKPRCVCGRVLRPFQLAPCEHCRADAEATR